MVVGERERRKQREKHSGSAQNIGHGARPLLGILKKHK